MAAKKTNAVSETAPKLGKHVDTNFAKCQIEALLFASGKSMAEEQLGLLAKLELSTVKKALLQLQQEYVERNGAITLYNDPTGWRLMVKEQFIGTVKNIVADTELSRACMETLAVIAYKYPKVLQSEVIDIRGAGAYEHMAELERLGFIRRDPEGRSYAVKLTDKFFSYFEVAGGADIRDVFKKIKPKQKPVGETGTKQKTLGDLEVVDEMPGDKKPSDKKAVGEGIGLEVVAVAKNPSRQNLQQDMPQDQSLQQDDVNSSIESREPDENSDSETSGAKGFEQASGKFELSEEEIDSRNSFLDELDKRIASISDRNTANDNDDGLKRRPLPGLESKDSSSGSVTADSITPDSQIDSGNDETAKRQLEDADAKISKEQDAAQNKAVDKKSRKRS